VGETVWRDRRADVRVVVEQGNGVLFRLRLLLLLVLGFGLRRDHARIDPPGPHVKFATVRVVMALAFG
jgi:hypothetical protein